MSNSRYSLFLKENFNLIRSLVIKNRLTALAFNEKLKLAGYTIDSTDESTWKYNLNLAGVPHESDEIMTVTSIDTLDEIEFNIETLSQHSATLSDFKTKGIAYIELVDRYPDQSVLIDGIMDPTDLDVVLSSPDWTILKYDTDLVEEQETNLIPRLQSSVDAFIYRWSNTDYALVDDLYSASLIGVLFAHMTGTVLDIRLDNCKTGYAHTFHIWSHLDRFQSLGDFSSALSTSQALFLYRNIEYISRRSYRNDVFKILVDALLTERGIPLFGYSLKHDISDIEENGPTATMSRDSINFESSSTSVDTRTLSAVLLDEIGLASKNYDLLEPVLKDTEDRLLAAKGDTYITKVLESDIRDTSNLDGISLDSLLLLQWLNLADTKVSSATADNDSTTILYRARIAVTDPATGAGIRMDAREAWIITMWLVARGDGVTLSDVPTVRDYHGIKTTLPTLDELKRFCVGSDITDDTLKYILGFPEPGVIVSSVTFRQHVVALRNFMIEQKDLIGDEEYLFNHMALTHAVDYLYEPKVYKFTDLTYDEWFKERGLTMDTMTDSDCATMALEIIDQFTGNTGVQQLSTYAIQTSMLEIVRRLVNYDLQYIQNLNESPTVIATNKTNRINDIRIKANMHVTLTDNLSDIHSVNVRSKMATQLKLPDNVVHCDSKTSSVVEFDPTVGIVANAVVRTRVIASLPYVRTAITKVTPIE